MQVWNNQENKYNKTKGSHSDRTLLSVSVILFTCISSELTKRSYSKEPSLI